MKYLSHPSRSPLSDRYSPLCVGASLGHLVSRLWSPSLAWSPVSRHSLPSRYPASSGRTRYRLTTPDDGAARDPPETRSSSAATRGRRRTVELDTEPEGVRHHGLRCGVRGRRRHVFDAVTADRGVIHCTGKRIYLSYMKMK